MISEELSEVTYALNNRSRTSSSTYMYLTCVRARYPLKCKGFLMITAAYRHCQLYHDHRTWWVSKVWTVLSNRPVKPPATSWMSENLYTWEGIGREHMSDTYMLSLKSSWLSTSTNDVCDVIYKDSPFRLDPAKNVMTAMDNYMTGW
jgi:hypothetical protein